MHRIVLALCCIGLLAGCEEPKTGMMDMGPPKPGPELAKLDRFVGTWSGTAEFVKPTREEMMKKMPKGAPMPPEQMQGGGTYSWMPGGLVLKMEGWYEMGPGQRMETVEYMGWNPREHEYWSGYLAASGERSRGEMKMDGNTMHVEAKGCDANGNPSRGKGTMTWVDNNTINWTWTEWTTHGEVQMKGTSHRVGSMPQNQSMQPMNQMAPSAPPTNAPQEVQVSPG